MFIVVRGLNNWIVTGHLPVSRKGLHWFNLIKELILCNSGAITAFSP